MRAQTPGPGGRTLRIGATLMFLALACACLVFAYAFLGRPPERADAAVRSAVASPAKPLVRTDPGIDPWVERDIPPPKSEKPVESQAAAGSTPASVPPQTVSAQKPSPGRPEPTPEPRPERRKQTTQSTEKAPPQEQRSGQAPPVEYARDYHPPVEHARDYHLPPGVIMTLTIPSLGLDNAPVLDSDTESALDRGVVHLPDTSLPWSDTPERNVYLAGHRLGWPGTGSRFIFYRLDELKSGQKITLRGPEGKRYDYRVTERFIVGPNDGWVTGRVEDRDLLTLQTCTPIPTFQNRLIVRAERSG